MASWVAGSSQDSGRRTVRLGTTSSVRRRQLAVEPREQVGDLGHRQRRRVELHLQRADAGGELGDARHVARRAACSCSACTRARIARSSAIGPYSTRTPPSPRAAQRDRRCRRRRRTGVEHAVVAVAGRRDHRRERRPPVDVDGAQRRRPVGAHRHEPHGVARAPSGRASTGRRPTTVTGQTNPPRLGPSGPSRIGVSPVKSSAPTQYAVSWMFDGCRPGLAAVGAGPLRLRPVEPHAGAVGVEVHRVVGADRRCRCRRG